MKSSTLRRSNITREKVAMMEALSRYNRQHQDEDFYRNQSKTKELDVLWQSFGVKPQKNEKTPQVYFVTGVVVGVIITLAVTTLVSLLISLSTPKDDMMPAPVKKPAASSGKFSFVPADSAASKPVAAAASNEEYVVKEGDTLESIIIRFYGTFDMTRVDAIQEANKMANPNALSIGQKLIIPMN
ncbi:MAG: LysM peptidoglycan-binding domain-containing protein [Candidatus Gastranaerophilales bacterium]|nr:LysM peptidoglycan-binding domain-containing protein [Candidatus Gastranaerophilales bacterium]MCM1073620.1 LysM peptidoglycan-binding domain-containing protein [Bacteroides sp.]